MYRDQDEEQQMLDHLLFVSDVCPFWAKPPVLGISKLSALNSKIVPSDAEKKYAYEISNVCGQDWFGLWHG